MERKKTEEVKTPVAEVEEEFPQEEEVEFVKTGRGSLRLNRRVSLGHQKSEKGTIIKPNQHFWARPSEIPVAFKDVVKPVAGLPPEPALNPVEPGYKLQPNTGDPKKFDVVDMQGKAMNEQVLTKNDAEELLKALAG